MKRLISLLLLFCASTLCMASSSALRLVIDNCSSRNASNFSAISKCIDKDYQSSRSGGESDFFIFLDEIEDDYKNKKQSLAKAKASLIRIWKDLAEKENQTTSTQIFELQQQEQLRVQENQKQQQLRLQEEQNRIAEEQKRQFEVIREQNYKACVRRNCVSFVDECTQSRWHCVR